MRNFQFKIILASNCYALGGIEHDLSLKYHLRKNLYAYIRIFSYINTTKNANDVLGC